MRECKVWESPYAEPRFYPQAKVHPRILMTPTSLGKIKANLTHPDHAAAYAAYLQTLERPLAISEVFTFDDAMLGVMRAKAAAYPLLDDAARGREAIDAILHALRSFYISPRGDICRAYGAMMYTAACIYDWAYALLTSEEREEILSLCESELAPSFEMGFPPSKQGMVTGHGTEAQLFRDWITLAIAVYDEHPEIYRFVAGRICEQAIPPRDFYFQSRSHHQGSLYGPYRYQFELYLALLFSRMTNGQERLFDPVMQEVATTFLCTFRADGEPFRDGDDPQDGNRQVYPPNIYRTCAFYAAALYRDPMLRDYALSDTKTLSVPALEQLLLDDPDVGRLDYRTHLPRVRYCPSPRGQYLGHHSSGASVSFKVGEAFSANHEAKDCGHFMIYYKGSLASAANCYQYVTASGEQLMYGSTLDFRYNKQTVSHNCMLVYDPDEEVSPKWGNSAGQRVDEESGTENATLEDWKRKSTFARSKILFHADGTDADGSLSYCLLGGDLTNAYSDKVTDYRRTSLAVATNDAERPLAVFVYDRLVTRDPAAEKTWQMHTMGKYEIDGRRAVTKHKDGGCLVLDSLLPTAAKLGVIGNETERFIVRGENLAEACDPKEHPIREDGRGRLTVMPASPAEVDHFLQAMYVTDCGKSIDVRAELITGEGYVAAALLDTVALFPTETDGLSAFSVALGDGAMLYATNLQPGLWSDGVTTYRVTAENRSLVTYARGQCSFSRIEE